MAPRVVTVQELPGLVGQHLGYSDWHDITQEQVNGFAEDTWDHQWIHVDVERAKTGPFGGPIAHGYLTLSLGPALQDEIWRLEGVALAINYGLNKVRFPAPVPVGSRVRLGAELQSAEERRGGFTEVVIRQTFEVDGQSRAACIAEMVILLRAGEAGA